MALCQTISNEFLTSDSFFFFKFFLLQKIQFKILQLDCNKYIDELQKEEKKCASLQTSLDLKQKAVDDVITSKNFTEDNLTKMKEMYEDMKRQYEELLAFQSGNVKKIKTLPVELVSKEKFFSVGIFLLVPYLKILSYYYKSNRYM